MVAGYDRSDGRQKDDRLSRDELGISPLVFAQYDTNTDGPLDDAELQKFVQNHMPDIVVTVRFGAKDAGLEPLVLTTSPELDVVPVGDPEKLAVTIAFGEAQLQFVVAPSATWGKSGSADGTVTMLEGLLQAIDRDKNGYLDLQEATRQPGLGALFRDLDRDLDGKVYLPEFMEFLNPIARAAACQSRLNITGGGVDFFQSLDRDKDGRLSIRELRALRKTVSQWDRNGDKQIARDEFPQRFTLSVDRAQLTVQTAGQRRAATTARQRPGNSRPQPDRSHGPVWFRMTDRNNDGEVSLREFLGRVEDFKDIDRDGDGLIDATEAGQRKNDN